MPHANNSFSSGRELLDFHQLPPSGPVDSDTDNNDASRACVFTGASAPAQNGQKVARWSQLCGWGALTPKAIQVFNTPRWVLFFLCVASFLQGMIINGFVNTVVTSIERRFDLHSYQSGVIVSSYDIAACVCLAFVSYFGGTGHKPRWLGWGVLLMGLGSLVFALPHFTTPPYRVSLSQQAGMCGGNRTGLCRDSGNAGLSGYRYVFMLGQFLHGMGATPLYTLGVTYLDENVKSNYGPVYIGIFYTAAIVGPAVGYLLGGYFLNIYTETSFTTEMTPENPLWVGAWWIGFLVGGAAALLVAFPILGYPRQLPGHKTVRVSEAHQLKDGSHTTASDPQFGKSVKDMPRSVLLLLKNPTFLFLCLAGATEATLISGMSTFGPKFLEAQFSLSASEAATWFGLMVVPAGGGGTFLGGYMVKRLNLRCRDIIRFCIVCGVVSMAAIFIFFINCPNVRMAGVDIPYSDLGPSYDRLHGAGNWSSWAPQSLNADCNAACGCGRELYNPVCGADAIMYYSPCHAGCSAFNQTSNMGRKVYSGCSCVVANATHDVGVAVAGKCGSACNHMLVFLIFCFVVMMFTFLCSIPALTATLRCVPDSQKSFGLGIQWILVRTLGSIPGPIAFGSMIDVSCLLWQDQCGDPGSCYLYQNSAMSHYMLIAGVIYKVLGTVFFLLASVLYQPPPESPQSPDPKSGDKKDLPVKDLPADRVIANPHAWL
ncbi:solute carrier organic anion transporter family member 4A1 [Nerophis lumbriciformis]|uniref:solute carrier organic anion transporter family member 4A1 n=1 Tax=Nerophis lumbriciformis TaxID=546530 RepID=UPI003BAA57EB